MKKLLLSTILAVLFGITSYAQETSFGIKGGLNYANIAGDDTEDLDAMLGYHFGAFAELGLSDKISIQPEILYSTQGTQLEYSEPDFSIDGEINLNYLNVPVLFKYYITDGLSVNAGPQLGFLLSAKYKVKTEGFGISYEEEDDIEENLKSTDFGVALGAEYKTPFGLRFHARYNLGLSNINDVDEDINKNTAIQVGIGFGI